MKLPLTAVTPRHLTSSVLSHHKTVVLQHSDDIMSATRQHLSAIITDM